MFHFPAQFFSRVEKTTDNTNCAEVMVQCLIDVLDDIKINPPESSNIEILENQKLKICMRWIWTNSENTKKNCVGSAVSEVTHVMYNM